MTCHTIQLPDGSRALVCDRARRSSKRREAGEPGGVYPCEGCGAGEAPVLCDYPVGAGEPGTGSGRRRTCSARLCAGCKVAVRGAGDLCPRHARLWKGETGT